MAVYKENDADDNRTLEESCAAEEERTLVSGTELPESTQLESSEGSSRKRKLSSLSDVGPPPSSTRRRAHDLVVPNLVVSGIRYLIYDLLL